MATWLSFQRSGSAELCAGIFNCFLSKQVLLGTQVSATGTLGLRKAGEFSVTTTWALVNPEVGDQYRMGLFDGFPGNTANDNAQIFVFHGATGPRLLLRTLDPSLGTIQNIATVDLSGTLAERVVFIFDHAANSSFVQGSYQLLSGLNVIGSGVLGQAELFRGEEVTRLSFGAAFAAPPIPEPAALALLLLGLPLIGVVARRRNLAQRSFRSA